MRIQLINTSITNIGKSLIYQLTDQFLYQFKIKKPGSAIGGQVGNLVCYLDDKLVSEGIYFFYDNPANKYFYYSLRKKLNLSTDRSIS